MRKLEPLKVAEKNTKVDMDQIREAQRQLEQLRELGVPSKKGYGLQSPYGQGTGAYDPLPSDPQLLRSFVSEKGS